MDNETGLSAFKQRIADTLHDVRPEKQVDELFSLFLEQLQTLSVKQVGLGQIVEPSEGVKLAVPPAGRTTYAARNSVYGNISPENFVQREWGDYANYSLLYVEHIRQLDISLYKACRHRARRLGMSSDDFFLELGILTKRYVQHAPPGADVAWQAAIINRARAFTLIEAANRGAAHSEPEGRSHN